jgi:P4 family phage/plasmid primase-like protien
VKLPLKWNPEPQEPRRFNQFLEELTDGDKDKQLVLREFIGVALTNINAAHMKKSLFLVGEGDSGKSQLRSLVERLLGDENCHSISLNALEARFGAGAIFGKRLIGSSDLSFANVPEVTMFKQIVGGDRVSMEKKFSEPVDAGFTGVVWFTMNKPPAFGGDRGKHVFDRILMVRCGKAVPLEMQDRRLIDKLYAEREGIVRDCIAAALVVVARGYHYSEPESSKKAVQHYALETSSVKSFLNECCTFTNLTAKKDECTLCSVVMAGYNGWCRDNNNKAVSRRAFVWEAADFYGVNAEDFQIHLRDGRYYPLVYHGRSKTEGDFSDAVDTDAI